MATMGKVAVPLITTWFCQTHNYQGAVPCQMCVRSATPTISDSDVERIARRVVELLREAP